MKKDVLLSALLFVSFVAQAKPLNERWVRVFENPQSSDNVSYADAVAVDGNGNAFVAGHFDTTNGSDFVTIKYSRSGATLWTNYYDGPGHGGDVPAAIALDRKGNVFVTGVTIADTSLSDYVTIAYSNGGLPRWTNFYSGFLYNAAQAIAVDRKGDVYVTGYSSGNFFDYVTIKYSNAGVPLWTNSFRAAASFINLPKTALALGKKGEVFVAGTSVNDASFASYATYAYSSEGMALWTNYYNGGSNDSDKASGIAVDNRNNVFVTGTSDKAVGGSDFVTVAYSVAGNPLWTNRFDGPGGGADSAKAIAVNDRGNVFVGGGCALFSDGGPSFGTVAYSRKGSLLWTNIYTVIGGDDVVTAMGTDSHGNVYVTGYSVNTGTGTDFATIEYSPSGRPISTNRYDGATSNGDIPSSIAIGRHGEVFVSGFSYQTNNAPDMTTIKYSH
jgi:hypothetical protein